MPSGRRRCPAVSQDDRGIRVCRESPVTAMKPEFFTAAARVTPTPLTVGHTMFVGRRWTPCLVASPTTGSSRRLPPRINSRGSTMDSHLLRVVAPPMAFALPGRECGSTVTDAPVRDGYISALTRVACASRTAQRDIWYGRRSSLPGSAAARINRNEFCPVGFDQDPGGKRSCPDASGDAAIKVVWILDSRGRVMP